MWLAADDRGGCTVANGKKGGLPAEAGEASWSQGEGAEDSFVHIGEVALAVVDRINRNRAARTVALRSPVASGGVTNVAPVRRRRHLE